MPLLPTHSKAESEDVPNMPSMLSARSDSGLSFHDEKSLDTTANEKDAPVTTARPTQRVNLKAAAISELLRSVPLHQPELPIPHLPDIIPSWGRSRNLPQVDSADRCPVLGLAHPQQLGLPDMLKAFTPVAIVLTSALFGIQPLNHKLLAIVLLISTGCALDQCRCGPPAGSEDGPAVLIALLRTQGLAPFQAIPRIGFFIMSTNALCAFLLNVAAVFLIGAAGGLVLTLAGVFKDILLISSSVIFFGSSVTAVQVFGYSLALAGLMIYKNTASSNKK
ncbi:Cas41p [Trichosporon asahii var. asahii CBS 8904]|uniref:GDP-mannose transporter n=1 Tax=Trichosporon asahii var. asahii (strain CBS 8904) TaxID=1220162 RepID=K1WS68_TRIAC|nr:Cas41p [Trichosporon asahii var. asahii CBS 8904]